MKDWMHSCKQDLESSGLCEGEIFHLGSYMDKNIDIGLA